MKPKILFADKTHEKALEKAREYADVTTDFEITPEKLISTVGEYDALVVRSRTKVTKEVIDAGKKLKVIGRVGVGLDNIDLEHSKQKGIPVVNAPTSLTVSVAELALGLMFCLARHLHHADRTMREGQWNKKKYYGVELYGKTLGVVGLGRIGRDLAIKCDALGMKVIAYDPYLTVEDFREYNTDKVELEYLLRNSDFVSLHIPAIKENENFLDAKKISMMKPTAFLINTSRGLILDEKALIKALKENKIRGAGLDVYEEEPLCPTSELCNLENVVLTPHIGAGTVDAQIVAGNIVVDEIKKILTKK